MAKKDTHAQYIVCVMSGNFMQRGIPSIIDKWERTKMALKNGVDLVIELPCIYAVSSAEAFAFGGISLLNNLNIIDNIYFGSENGNINDLSLAADVFNNEPDEFKHYLKNFLKEGLPYHTSRTLALKKYSSYDIDEYLLSKSNNILAIEYIKSIKKLNSSINYMTTKRKGASYNSFNTKTEFASATSIRNLIMNNDINKASEFLTPESFEILNKLIDKNYKFTYAEDMYNYIRFKILTDSESLKNIPDVTEGLDKKIEKEILNSSSLNELILNIKSKRYTYTRISRILTQFFLGFEKYPIKDLSKKEASYARILGFNKNGRILLKDIKNKSNINLITKFPKHLDNDYLKLDLNSTKCYSLINPQIRPNEDYFRSPIII